MNINHLLKDALAYAQQGNLAESKTLLLKIDKKYPNHPIVLANLGLINIQAQNYADAELYFKRSCEVKFNAGIFKNYIQVLSIRKKWAAIIDQISHKKSNEFDKDILLNYAIALREIGEIEKFQWAYENLLKDNPNFENGWISYGFSLNKYKLYDKAIQVFKEALDHFPNNFLILYNLGISYANVYDAKQSMHFLKRASHISTNSFSLWITLAAQQAKMRMFSDAKTSLDECKKIEPQNNLILFQESSIQMFLGNVNKAEELLSELILKEPEHIDANYHMGVIKLIKGKYKEAHKFYRYRIKTNDMPVKFDDFEVDQLDPQKKVLIGWEQGIGDQFLYFRLMQEFLEKYNNITYIATDKTCSVFQRCYPEIKVISDTFYEKNKDSFDDYQKINLASIINYLPNVEDALLQARNIHLDNHEQKDKKIIGLSWKSENKKLGHEKSIDLTDFKPLLSNKFDFISLQYGDVQKEIESLNKLNKAMVYHDKNFDYYNDIEGLLSKISTCKLVITISNITVHLAGSLKIPTILLVPKNFGKLWYWHNNENYSKWYPSVKIVKQSIDRDWKKEIIEIQKIIDSQGLA